MLLSSTSLRWSCSSSFHVSWFACLANATCCARSISASDCEWSVIGAPPFSPRQLAGSVPGTPPFATWSVQRTPSKYRSSWRVCGSAYQPGCGPAGVAVANVGGATPPRRRVVELRSDAEQVDEIEHHTDEAEQEAHRDQHDPERLVLVRPGPLVVRSPGRIDERDHAERQRRDPEDEDERPAAEEHVARLPVGGRELIARHRNQLTAVDVEDEAADHEVGREQRARLENCRCRREGSPAGRPSRGTPNRSRPPLGARRCAPALRRRW